MACDVIRLTLHQITVPTPSSLPWVHAVPLPCRIISQWAMCKNVQDEDAYSSKGILEEESVVPLEGLNKERQLNPQFLSCCNFYSFVDDTWKLDINLSVQWCCLLLNQLIHLNLFIFINDHGKFSILFESDLWSSQWCSDTSIRTEEDYMYFRQAKANCQGINLDWLTGAFAPVSWRTAPVRHHRRT